MLSGSKPQLYNNIYYTVHVAKFRSFKSDKAHTSIFFLNSFKTELLYPLIPEESLKFNVPEPQKLVKIKRVLSDLQIPGSNDFLLCVFLTCFLYLFVDTDSFYYTFCPDNRCSFFEVQACTITTKIRKPPTYHCYPEDNSY